VIRALGGQVNTPADKFDNVVYNNYNSTNNIDNYGVSGQLDYDISDAFTVTSISAFRKSNADTVQDSDFSSADLIYPNSQNLNIGTFTQELRLTGEIADRIDLLLGAFYINEDIDQQNQLIYASQFRTYANTLSSSSPAARSACRCSKHVRRARRHAATPASSSRPGRASTSSTRSIPKPSRCSARSIRDHRRPRADARRQLHRRQQDLRHQRRVERRVSRASTSTRRNTRPFRNTLLRGGALAQGVGTAAGLGRPATAAEIAASPVPIPPRFG
jgi:hypothetical protein